MAAVRRLRANRYQVDFMLFGHRVRTNFFTESEAIDFQAKIISEFSFRKITIAKAIEKYLKDESDKRKSITSRNCERFWFHELRFFLRTKKIYSTASIAKIKRIHLEEFQGHLKRNGSKHGKKLTNSSINRRFHSLKNLFRKLEEWGFIKSSPARGIIKLPEKINRRRPWTDVEIQIFLRSSFINKEDREFAEFLLETGARVSSAIQLRLPDIDLEERTVLFRQRKGMGEESMYLIPLSDRALEIVSGRILGVRDSRLFDYSEFTKVDEARMMSKRYSRALFKLGLSHLKIHGLRHTFATRLNSAGAPLQTIRNLLGHRARTMTEGYTHSEIEDLRKWISKTKSPA